MINLSIILYILLYIFIVSLSACGTSICLQYTFS